MTSDWLRVRLFIVLGFIVFFFGLIFLRAFQIQVIDGGDLERLARNQHNRVVKVESKRGAVLDRNLKELAVSLDVDSVFVRPKRVDDASGASVTIARTLAKTLGMKRRDVERSIKGDRNFSWLKRQVDLTADERAALKGFKGIGVVKEARRFYPNKSLSSNLVGFAGIDSKGLEGVELRYDRFLKGATHRIDAERDARGKVLLYEDIHGVGRGMDVVLTIDMFIQYITEKALKRAVESSGAKGGTVVVMEPTTGEILAMATLPTFDPNDFRGYTPSDWRNRPVTDTFEPGSTLKVFLLAALLDEGVAAPNDIFFCENGRYEFADRVFHDSKEHGWLSLAKIIKVSSNIGALKSSDLLGNERLYGYLRDFGFGRKTGVDLPGEASGVLRHHRNWTDVDRYAASFGQGISVTALQMASALSAVANGGYLMKPYVVSKVLGPKGGVAFEATPRIERRVISEKTASKVSEILVTVTEPGGTGVNASGGGEGDAFQVAGKTGTAQKVDLVNGGYYDDKYVASFIGIAPVGEPKLTVVVTIDEPVKPYTGGDVAAPVFREIVEQSLAYLGHYPGGLRGADTDVLTAELDLVDAPEVAFETPPSIVSHPGWAMPDLSSKTMRAVLRVAGERNFEVNMKGSGSAVRQSPLAGEEVPTDGAVTVWFR